VLQYVFHSGPLAKEHVSLKQRFAEEKLNQPAGLSFYLYRGCHRSGVPKTHLVLPSLES
jgi:hypothetical protein